ncbi:MAG: CPBP family intramembrane metalloprotease [Ktedonobacteraceae bacterium]|nr:CPBP family intramembrane metalloprotease [Ktedonobacteraceae bacterium]
MSSIKSQQVAYSTVIDSWRWMRPDLLMRILPMGAVPLIYITVVRQPLSAIGLTLRDVPLQLLSGLIIGMIMAAFSILYRMYIVGPWFRRPTKSDQIFQSFFYLFINAPVEELFFRGFMLEIITAWTGWPALGWLISTAVYTLYHRLGKWNWRSVAGVGLAGIVFSSVYLFQPTPRSLLAVTIVHGFATSGFLSWGDEALYQRWRRRHAQDEA